MDLHTRQHNVCSGKISVKTTEFGSAVYSCPHPRTENKSLHTNIPGESELKIQNFTYFFVQQQTPVVLLFDKILMRGHTKGICDEENKEQYGITHLTSS